MGKDVVGRSASTASRTGRNPIALALEWGVRRLGEQLELRSRAGQVKPVTADVFPAYDDDGGVLVALSSRTLAHCRKVPSAAQPTAASFAWPATDGWK